MEMKTTRVGNRHKQKQSGHGKVWYAAFRLRYEITRRRRARDRIRRIQEAIAKRLGHSHNWHRNHPSDQARALRRHPIWPETLIPA